MEWIPVLAFALAAASVAPTAREAAVAIDAVALPAADEPALQRIASGLRLPWSIAFLPGGGMLVVEKHHGVRAIAPDASVGPLLKGAPSRVLAKEDSGFLDIALDPDFAENRRIYLAFVEGDEAANRTAVFKAEFDGKRLRDGRVIFRANVAKKGPSHPGGRLLFLKDGTLLLTVGDGYDYRDAAQDMASHLGKVLRLTREGAAAPDNPFVATAGAAPEIWTAGHRNIQGLTLHPETGEVWSHEHGPRGGDEINLLKPGLNYGWPTVSHGIDYDGTIITRIAVADGFEQSKFYWAPSIAPSGLTIVGGERYRDWKGKFLVGGLASRSLVRLRVGRETLLLVEEARLFAALRARIRDVREGPDGLLYLLTDDEKGDLLRLVPG